MNKSLLWVEKNRPQKISEICHQEEVCNGLQNLKNNANIPHLLFYGPSGCGKTSAIYALARELFGDYYKERIYELNASDERGINVVREKIKTYAAKSINRHLNLPPWKIIILDEADNMTIESQYTLRTIMEEHSKVTRFCIICNYYYKIINPIVSRCSIFRFKPIPEKIIATKLQEISILENMNLNKTALKKISNYSRGDLRKAINFLQRCKNSFDDKINDELIDEMSGFINKNYLTQFINTCLEKNEILVLEMINYIYTNSFSFINQLVIINDIINEIDIDDDKKCKIFMELVNIDQNLLKSSNELIQLYHFSYFLMTL